MSSRFGLALLILSALVLASCGESNSIPTAPAPLPGNPPSNDPQPGDAEVAAFVDLVNAHRVANGSSALIWDSAAAAVALAHSEDMATRDFFGHTNPDGESPFDRMRTAGIHFTLAGENIAYGYPTGSAVFNAWMNSPGHRSNIEKAAYTHHGVGRHGTYWTHVFFTPPAS